MITKMMSLDGLGLFLKGIPDRPVHLGRYTVIYSDNGRGKTTLADLWRSLATGDCRRLQQRATFGGPAPSAKLLAASQTMELTDYRWSALLKDIEIFDATFVHQNVHRGPEVDPSHRGNLCRFVLGREGVSLANQVEELNNQIGDANTALGANKKALQAIVGDVMTLEAFSLLAQDSAIDTAILAKEKAVEAARDAAVVLGQAPLKAVQLQSVRAESQIGSLRKTVSSLAGAAAQRVQEHISAHLGPDGEQWLQAGLKHMRTPHCPFCGQDVNGVPLVEAYAGFFAMEYQALSDEVREATEVVASEWSEARLREIQAAFADNAASFHFWSKYAAVKPLPEVWPTVEKAWLALRKALLDAMEAKRRDIVGACEPPHLSVAVMQYEEALAAVALYNQQISISNAAIDECKEKITSQDMPTVTHDLAVARLQKKRWESDPVALLNKKQSLEQAKQSLVIQKDRDKERLFLYMNEMMAKYESNVNDFLESCGANFSIVKMSAGFAGGSPRTEYLPKLLGHEIKLTAKDVTAPTFDSVLSEGDKRTLAFAFFLARLQAAPNLQETTVIMDDPICSLDIHRRRSTCKAIASIAGKCGQLIIMTHDTDFARSSWDTLSGLTENGESEMVGLKIRRAGKYSVLEPCDIASITRSRYEYMASVLQEFDVGTWTGSDEEVAKAIRPTLEGVLRIKYPDELGSLSMLGKMLMRISDVDENSDLYSLKTYLPVLNDINDYCRDFHHLKEPLTERPPENGELHGYVHKTRKLIRLL